MGIMFWLWTGFWALGWIFLITLFFTTRAPAPGASTRDGQRKKG